MSKYTTTLKVICENYAKFNHLSGEKSVNEIIEKSRKYIFDFSYPIFDEDYRPILETKILKHFYIREIGLETVGLWKFYLNSLMNEIMPFYNKMYYANNLTYGIFDEVNINTEHSGTNLTTNNTQTFSNSENTTNSGVNNKSDNTTENINLFSDTPQGGISGLNENGYLTNATKNTEKNESSDTQFSNSSGKSSQSDNSVFNGNVADSYVQKVIGKNSTRSYSSMVKEYQENLINIDQMIFNDLNTLFMNIW